MKIFKKYTFSQNYEGVALKICLPCPFQFWTLKGCGRLNFWATPLCIKQKLLIFLISSNDISTIFSSSTANGSTKNLLSLPFQVPVFFAQSKVYGFSYPIKVNPALNFILEFLVTFQRKQEKDDQYEGQPSFQNVSFLQH